MEDNEILEQVVNWFSQLENQSSALQTLRMYEENELDYTDSTTIDLQIRGLVMNAQILQSRVQQAGLKIDVLKLIANHLLKEAK